MKKHFTNCLIVLLLGILCVTFTGLKTADAVTIENNDDGTVATGDFSKYGSGVQWELTVAGKDSHLELFGSGSLPDNVDICDEVIDCYIQTYNSFLEPGEAEIGKNDIGISVLDVNGVSIGKQNFEACELDRASLDDVRKIGAEAFKKGSIDNIHASGVKTIGADAFSDFTAKTFSFGDSVKTVETGAFYNCKGLKEISFDGDRCKIGEGAFMYSPIEYAVSYGVTSVGDMAFYGCSRLKTITFPNLESVGDSAFLTDNNFTSVELGGSITITKDFLQGWITYLTLVNNAVIDDQAFKGKVTDELVIDSNVTVGSYAFSESKIKNVIVSSGAILKEDALADCSIGNVVIKAGAQVGKKAFYNSTIEAVSLDPSLESIGEDAFGIDTDSNIDGNITNVDVINSNTNYGSDRIVFTLKNAFKDRSIDELHLRNCDVGDEAFRDVQIKKISLEGVEKIGRLAFAGNKAIKSINLKSILQLDAGCFKDCSNLASVRIENAEAPEAAEDTFDGTAEGLEIFVDTDYDVIGYDVKPWTDYILWMTGIAIVPTTSFGTNMNFRITGDGTLYIDGKGTFPDFDSAEEQPWHEYKDSIRKIVIEDYNTTNISNIGARAFDSLTKVKSVTLTDDVKTIGKCAFMKIGIESVELPASLTEIGEAAFRYCENLTTVYANPTTAPVVGLDAFSDCSELSDLYISNDADRESYRSHPWNLFKNIHFRGRLIVSGKCGDDAEWGLYSSGELVISGTGPMYDYTDQFDGATVSDYWNYPWYDYRGSFGTVTIEEGITSIGANAFNRCFAVNKVNIASTVETIGGLAFSSDENLTSVKFAEGSALKEIQTGAFNGCSRLHNFEFPEGLESIGIYAFSNCNKITEQTVRFNIPASVREISPGAFNHCYVLVGIYVDDANPYYNSVDGVLYTEDMKTVVAFPTSVNGQIYSIPETVTRIEDYAFSYCPGITLYLPEGLEEIGSNAFDCARAHCICTEEDFQIAHELFKPTEPKALIIPETVRSIGKDAFSSCPNISYVMIRAQNAPEIGGHNDMWIDGGTVIHVPADSIGYDKYPWYYYNLVFGDENIIPVQYMKMSKEKYVGRLNNNQYSPVDFDLSVELFPALSENESVTWTCSNDKVLTLTPDEYTANDHTASCKVTVLEAGRATITATSSNGSKAVCKVTINPYAPGDYCEENGHNYQCIETVAPLCEQDGYEVYTCTVCNSSYTETIPATGHHDWSEWEVSREATDTQAGLETRICSNCDKTEERAIPAKGHSYGDWKTVKQATCTDAGRKERICSSCGEKETQTVNATGHKWETAYTVDKKATYASAGSKSIHCSVCGEKKPGSAVSIPKLTVKPTTITSLKASSKAFTVKWKKGTSVTGYQIQYAVNSTFTSGKKTVTVKKAGTVSKKIAKLKGKKKYYVRIRTYKESNGKKYYSKWSSKKSVTTKK